MLLKRYRDVEIDATQRSAWMPAIRHPLHREDGPNGPGISAVIITSVLNGPDVYGSGRHLARPILPISGGMCTSLLWLSSTASCRPMLNSAGTSMPAHPRRPGIRPMSHKTRSLGTSPHSFEHEGEGEESNLGVPIGFFHEVKKNSSRRR